MKAFHVGGWVIAIVVHHVVPDLDAIGIGVRVRIAGHVGCEVLAGDDDARGVVAPDDVVFDMITSSPARTSMPVPAGMPATRDQRPGYREVGRVVVDHRCCAGRSHRKRF